MVLAQEEAEEALETLGRLTLEDWLIAAGIVIGSIVLARIVSVVLRRLLAPTPTSRHAIHLIARFAAYSLVIVGFVYALNTVNVPVAPLLGALGLAGIALAFAFQDILGDLIAGLGMQLRRPIRPGDEIEASEFAGTVVDVNLREVLITTFDGETVFLPNSSVWKNPILNSTRKDSRRTTLTVGVAYDTDLDRAKQVLESATASVKGVLADPAPTAQVREFGESSVNFDVRYWHRPRMAELLRVRDEVARCIKRELNRAEIVIPFPQRVLHHRGQLPR